MRTLRITFLTVLALAVLPASNSLCKTCAQTPGITQNIRPDGSITTVSTRPGESVITQNITPQSMVITQSILSDGTVLSNDMRPGGGRTNKRNTRPPTVKKY